MEQLVKLHRESALGRRLPAYDGRKSLYTAGPLPFQLKEFQIDLLEEDDGSNTPRWEKLVSGQCMFVCYGDEHLSHWHFNLHSLETKSMFDPSLFYCGQCWYETVKCPSLLSPKMLGHLYPCKVSECTLQTSVSIEDSDYHQGALTSFDLGGYHWAPPRAWCNSWTVATLRKPLRVSNNQSSSKEDVLWASSFMIAERNDHSRWLSSLQPVQICITLVNSWLAAKRMLLRKLFRFLTLSWESFQPIGKYTHVVFESSIRFELCWECHM